MSNIELRLLYLHLFHYLFFVKYFYHYGAVLKQKNTFTCPQVQLELSMYFLLSPYLAVTPIEFNTLFLSYFKALSLLYLKN